MKRSAKKITLFFCFLFPLSRIHPVEFVNKSPEAFCFNQVRGFFEDVAYKTAGRTFLTILGYSPDPSCCYVVGDKQSLPKLRITFINGILNIAPDVKDSAKMISDYHGGA